MTSNAKEFAASNNGSRLPVVMKLQSPFTYVPLSSSVQQDFCLYRFLSDFCQSDDAIEFPFAVLAVMEQIRCDLEINLLKRKVLQLIYFLLIVRVFT